MAYVFVSPLRGFGLSGERSTGLTPWASFFRPYGALGSGLWIGLVGFELGGSCGLVGEGRDSSRRSE